MDEQAAREDMLLAFNLAHTKDSWVTPLAEALEVLTAADARWKPGPRERSIWEIVLHMTTWTNNVVEALHGIYRDPPPEGAWPPLPKDLDDAAWHSAREKLFDTLRVLQEQIAWLTSADLFRRDGVHVSRFLDIISRLIHNAYHIGQITKLRACKAALADGKGDNT